MVGRGTIVLCWIIVEGGILNPLLIVIVPKTLADRVHKCLYCGLEMDRDLNASLNIVTLGLRGRANRDTAKAGLRSRKPYPIWGREEVTTELKYDQIPDRCLTCGMHRYNKKDPKYSYCPLLKCPKDYEQQI